jgi:holliday junction DNA helicase RuvA
MIAYLKGSILHFGSDNIVLLAGEIGYEVVLNPHVLEEIRSHYTDNNGISLYIHYYQTEKQPKPVLIGFRSMDEKAFFQKLIPVDAIGPLKAIKALSLSISDIALAIEKKNTDFLTGLNGIGKRTAEKIIAALNGKVQRFIVPGAIQEPDSSMPILSDKMKDIGPQVEDVLVEQLGHSQSSARRMIREAFNRNRMIATPEELFDEIYKENK